MQASAILGYAFIVSHVALVAVLTGRRWWKGAPCFMALMAATAGQSIISSFGRPHPPDSPWWNYVWAPSEMLILLLSAAASFEILWHRSSFADRWERFTCRLCIPFFTVGVVMGVHSIGPYSTWFGLFVYVREWVWIGLFVVNGVLAGFLSIPVFDPVKEPRTLERHAYIFLAMMLTHAIIAPLARIGFNAQTCQTVFMAVMIVCCTAWIMLCSPASAQSAVPGSGIGPASRPEKPYRA